MTDQELQELLVVFADALEQGGRQVQAAFLRALSAGKAEVWIVEGHCGEYSDSRDWACGCHMTEQAAQEHVEAATRRCQELLAQHDGDQYLIPDGANEFDPWMSLSYTGVNYTCYQLPLCASLPEVCSRMGQRFAERVAAANAAKAKR